MLIEQGCENATYQFICISFIKGFMDYATSAMNAKVYKKRKIPDNPWKIIIYMQWEIQENTWYQKELSAWEPKRRMYT